MIMEDRITDRHNPLFETAVMHCVNSARTAREEGRGVLPVVTEADIRLRLHRFLNDGTPIEMSTNDANGNIVSLSVAGQDVPALIADIARSSGGEIDNILAANGC